MIVQTVATDAVAVVTGGPTASTDASAFAAALLDAVKVSPKSAGAATNTAAARTSAPAASADALTDRIAGKVQTLLSSGMSFEKIVKSIAASIAAALGTPNDSESASRIENAVASALAPPGEPPPTRSDGARTLATRLRSIVERLARGVDEAGQQQRSSGDVSDATPARENPAPATSDPQTGTSPAVIAPGGFALDQRFLLAGGSSTADGAAAAAKAANPVTTRDRLRSTGTPTAIDSLTLGAGSAAKTTVDATTPLTTPALPIAGPHAAHNTGSRSFGDMQTADYGSDRRVATGERFLESGSGSTSLGRVLERAALAASANDPFASSRPSNAAASATGADAKAKLDAAILSSLDAIVSAIPVPAAPVTPVVVPSTDVPVNAGALAAVASPVSGPAAVTAPHTAAPVSAPVMDPFHVIDQVVRGVTMRTLGSSSEIRLRLNPEHLGDVTVKLVVNGDAVNASILTQSAEARDALAGGATQLNRSFAEAGLKLQNLSVDLSGGGFAGFPQHHTGSHEQPSAVQRFSFGRDDGDESDALAAVPSFGPPDAANTGLGAHNYLV